MPIVRNAILPGLLVLVLALAWVVFAAASRVDRTSTAREESVVTHGIGLQQQETRRSLAANTIWDDAVRHLDQTFDPAWARTYLGQFLTSTYGVQIVYVLDRSDQPVFAYEGGRPVDPRSFAPLAAALAPLIADIRSGELARGPYRVGETRTTAAIDGSTVSMRGTQAYLLSASLVQTDHGGASHPSARAPIVVVGQAVDKTFLHDITSRYLLEGVRVIPASAAVPEGYASAPVSDAAGRTVVRLAWKSNSPTSSLAEPVGLPLTLAILALVVVAGLMVRHERLRSRDLLLATRAARSASDAKSAFLATMSHEIRTPLNGVLGMTQAIAMEPLSPAQRERLEVVRQSGESLLAILNDVLDMSKIEAGKLTLESIEFDLAGLMNGVTAAFTAMAEEKGLGFSMDIGGAEGTYRGDPTRIRQILYNLISNALKFTTAGDIKVRAEAIPDGLRLSVSDTGVGVEAEKLPILFGKFVQAEASTTRRFGGAGLGLSICRELVDLMEGSIKVRSRPGVGTTFVVDLRTPRIGSPRVAAALPSPESRFEAVSGHSLRVLVAEDNPVNQLVVRTLLNHFGVEPVLVDNGALAVEAWATGKWDLIFMDVQMPVMDGLDAARTIRDQEAGRGCTRTPIIALTANVMAHQVEEIRAAGMDGHVAKPIEAQALLDALTEFAPDPVEAERGSAQDDLAEAAVAG